jgi:hypothetical protein
VYALAPPRHPVADRLRPQQRVQVQTPQASLPSLAASSSDNSRSRRFCC